MDRVPRHREIEDKLAYVEREFARLETVTRELLAQMVDLDTDMRLADRSYLLGDDAAEQRFEPPLAA